MPFCNFLDSPRYKNGFCCASPLAVSILKVYNPVVQGSLEAVLDEFRKNLVGRPVLLGAHECPESLRNMVLPVFLYLPPKSCCQNFAFCMVVPLKCFVPLLSNAVVVSFRYDFLTCGGWIPLRVLAHSVMVSLMVVHVFSVCFNMALYLVRASAVHFLMCLVGGVCLGGEPKYHFTVILALTGR